MDFSRTLKQQLLFFYYTNIQTRKKLVIIVASVFLLGVSFSAALYSLRSGDRFTALSDAQTTFSKDKLIVSDNSIIKGSEGVAKALPTPTPTLSLSLADEEFRTFLENALETTWKKINLLPESEQKINLNAIAAEVDSLLKANKIIEAQTLLATLILTTNTSILLLTPSPTPTESPAPTLTPIPTPTPLTGPPPIGYTNSVIVTEKGRFMVKVIAIDMNEATMITDTGNDTDCENDCNTKTLVGYIQQNNAFAGVNGTYFCPPDYAECASKKNSFDFPVYNSRLKKWINGQNLSWNNRAILYKNTNGYVFKSEASSAWRLKYPDWYPDYKLEAAITNAPGLLENGNVIANNYPLTDKQKAKSAKVGIGFNGKTVFLIIAYNVSMEEFGYVFKGIGATDALNLDSGGSAAMWYGNYKAGPGRSLPNAIVFVRK